MKIYAALVMAIFAHGAVAQVVHLDCIGKVEKVLYGDVREKVGDVKGPYLFDIDLDNKTGTIGNWSGKTFSTDPNDPDTIMTISETAITFGHNDMPWIMLISREDLSFRANMKYGGLITIKGECELVEKREPPKRAF